MFEFWCSDFLYYNSIYEPDWVNEASFRIKRTLYCMFGKNCYKHKYNQSGIWTKLVFINCKWWRWGKYEKKNGNRYFLQPDIYEIENNARFNITCVICFREHESCGSLTGRNAWWDDYHSGTLISCKRWQQVFIFSRRMQRIFLITHQAIDQQLMWR